MPWDTGLANEAVGVVDFGQLPWNKEMLVLVLMSVYVIFMICVICKKTNHKQHTTQNSTENKSIIYSVFLSNDFAVKMYSSIHNATIVPNAIIIQTICF